MGQLDLKKLKDNFWLHFVTLFCVALALYGKPVPYSNEYSYLLKLVKTFNPDFLANDFTFSNPPNAYWLFNHLFGVFTLPFSIEVVGWGGRIACWSVLLYALIRLGKRWEIPLWMISLSIFLWLAMGQSLVADEWMIGGFEAKCVAYICLLFALDGFCDGRDIVSAILLGLTFSFHPVVGLWGIAATLFALLIWRRDLVRVVKTTVISGAFSLIGLIPILLTPAVKPTPENLKILELVKFPYHYDPSAWARSSIVLLYLMMTLCLVFHFQNRDDKSGKFLTGFLSVLCLFFTAGILLMAFKQYGLSEYMPMRLFPIFAPLFFLFTVARTFNQKAKVSPGKSLAGVGIACLSLIIWSNPFSVSVQQVQTTYEKWTAKPDDSEKAFVWINKNTPNGTIVIAPPWRFDYWHLSQRAQIVSYNQPTYSNLNEWQKRVDQLVGIPNPENGIRENYELASFYYNLRQKQVDRLAGRYKAAYLISESDYSYERVFESGKQKVYRLGP